ncbi:MULTISPECIES: DUF421 domain-containing protein [Nitrosomonas]|jgi:uncharacterized membrane protein YcaP (DUF421 family)|uniref:Membrane protein n=1 Tax=Nitrosomonas communis TaxID=44574 RepID=A0A0F7KFW4_9PROT|nr:MULTISPECIES: YetF domain-containing protein [Nitrosomonas]AKH37739.1 membrane protein [Nitrosomonas communis]TYP72992.1 uncharacterized protein DUF421 [Nitrosomonas communis]UVS63067.1 DUF421 domain-containing protein [Nitrosomonas sp. PLL12]
MNINWNEIFGITVSPLELVVRGTAIYFFLFVIFRVLIKRRVGSIGMADILILVIVADAAQNGMAGDYRSVSEAFILIGTIICWNQFLDWLSFHVPQLKSVLEPAPLLLINKGQILWRNMQKEYMTESELLSKLREHEITDLKEIEKAYMESDGQITVLKKKP